MVRTLKENIIRTILAAVLLTVLFAFPSYAKDYRIYDCWWGDTETGISAEWEKAEDPTKYRVKLYKDNQTKGSSVTTSKHSKDMTDLLLKYGPGEYHFEVYPIKGGQDLKVVSEALDFDIEQYAQIRHKKKRTETASPAQASQSAGQEKSNSGFRLSSPDGIYLDEEDMLRWNTVENAYKYLLRFYRDDEIIGIEKTEKHGIDISGYMEECTDIRLSAIGERGRREIISSKPAVFYVEGYCPEGWEYRSGHWFYFINGEKCAPGWFEDEDGHKYYFDSGSRMKTGYVRVDGQKYFFNDGTYEEIPLGAYIPDTEATLVLGR